MRARLVEAAVVAALAGLITVVLAVAVIRAPSERLFGMDIVGRHHDPFTVMEQFRGPIAIGAYTQPVTDIPGMLIARVAGPVAAYNWLILVSFPLAAAAAYLLARHLALSRLAAGLAAMAYAFAPFHLAQAAYHVHVAQTQWIPLYLLALWHSLDRPTWRASGLLLVATIAVTLSNFYAGLIMAVTTPIAAAGYWLSTRQRGPRPWRRLAITAASLLLIGAAASVYAARTVRVLDPDLATVAFPRSDLFRYSARWWGYLVPPVASPLFGDASRRLWTDAGVGEGLLEQQVSLGWGTIALSLVAVFAWCASGRRLLSRRYIPLLAGVAMFGIVCSLSPERAIGPFTFVRPSALLYHVAPMFRSYARFGVVVQLMAALLAGIGVDWLRRTGTGPAQALAIALVAMTGGEYLVLPTDVWRDALPTQAHRWAAQQSGRMLALDCTPLDQESASIPQLTGHRVALLGGPVPDCTDTRLPETLAANGFTHLLLRRRTPISHWFADRPTPDGLTLAARFNDALVFAVTAPHPSIYTASMRGVYPPERAADLEWRWMEPDASWTVVNTTARSVVATLSPELWAFRHARRMDVWLDGRQVQTLMIDPLRRVHLIGPLTVGPGYHDLVFRGGDSSAATAESAAAPPGDPRNLAFALGAWRWTVRSVQP